MNLNQASKLLCFKHFTLNMKTESEQENLAIKSKILCHPVNHYLHKVEITYNSEKTYIKKTVFNELTSLRNS